MCKNIGEHITKPKRTPISRTQQKYVDDMTQCAAMNLKETTEMNQNPTLPLQYHERTGHRLDPLNNPIQTEVTRLAKYASDHKMRITS